METEMEVNVSISQEFQELSATPRAEVDREGFFSRASRESTGLCTLDFGLLDSRV